MGGVLIKNVTTGGQLIAGVTEEDVLFCNVPVITPMALPCRRNNVVNLAQPYKTSVDGFDMTESVVRLPDLPASDPKLIDCTGAQFIAVYILAPYDWVLSNYAEGIIGIFGIGYVAKDAEHSVYCPTFLADSWDSKSIFTGQPDEMGEAQFAKVIVDSVTCAVTTAFFVPTFGFAKMQLCFCHPSFEVGISVTGTFKFYCVPN